MQIINSTIPSDCDLALCGDTHEGTILQYEDGIEKFVDWVRSDPCRRWIHLGDWIEAITTDDKRYDDCHKRDKPGKQRDAIIEKFLPIAEQGLGGLDGNHDRKLHRVFNIAEEICKSLHIPFGTFTAKFCLSDAHGFMFKLFVAHGFGRLTSNAKDSEQRLANMKAALKVRLRFKAADCLVMAMGHTHKLFVVEPTGELYLADDGDTIKQHYLSAGDPTAQYIHPDQRWYANTGSFLKLYGEGVSGYGELAGYDPIEMGYVVIEIRDRKVNRVYKQVI